MRCWRTSTAWRASAVLAAFLVIAGAGGPARGAEESGADLRTQASAFLAERAREAGIGLRSVEIEAPLLEEPRSAPAAWRFKIARPVTTGRLALTAIAEEEGRPVRSMIVTAEVVAEADLPVAAVDLPSGRLIGPDDYRIERRALPEGMPPEGARIRPVGMALRTGVPAGRILTASMVAPPREVARGEIVTLLAEGRGFSIRVTARAGRDGARGERIPVVNATSGQTVIAEVIGRGLVRCGPPAGAGDGGASR